MNRLWQRTSSFLRTRWDAARGITSDRGASAPEWAFITAACLGLAGLIFAAVQSGVAEKITQIKGS